MTSVLDGPFTGIRERMREVLARPEFAYRDGSGRHDYRETVLDWTRMLAAEGIGSLAYPVPYGQDDSGSFVAAIAMLGHHDLSLLTKFGVQFGLFGGSIASLGTERHHDRVSGRHRGAAAPWLFRHDGNRPRFQREGYRNHRHLRRCLRRDRGDHPPRSRPEGLIGNAAAHGRLAVVFARLMVDETDHGVHAVLVPIRADDGSLLPGIRVEDNQGKGGLNGVDNGRIWFDRVRVPRDNLLDRFASIDDAGNYQSDIPNPDRRFFTMIGTLVGGRVGVGAASVSVAKTALTIAVRYAHRRRQFGAPGAETLLIDYPIHQQRLIPRLAATYAYHFAIDDLIADYADSRIDQRALEAGAAGLKAYASWHAIDTVQTAREACGGQGFLAANRLTATRADADIFTTYEGDNTVLAQLVARALLSDFRHQFESLNPLGLLRHIARRAAQVAAEASPITISTTDDIPISDPSWQLDQLKHRVRHQVESLARRVKSRIDSGKEPFQAFTEVQAHAAAATKSHVEHRVLEAFVSAVDRLEDGPVRDALDRLRTLHGLATIRGDLGWFQEHHLMSASTVSAIVKLHDRLVSEVARDSLALVDAFAIPNQVLAAPIAAYNQPAKEET